MSQTSSAHGQTNHIFSRALKANRFVKGDKVKIKGTPLYGEVVMIEEDPDMADWTGMSPAFVKVVYTPQGSENPIIKAFKPRDLKRKAA